MKYDPEKDFIHELAYR